MERAVLNELQKYYKLKKNNGALIFRCRCCSLTTEIPRDRTAKDSRLLPVLIAHAQNSLGHQEFFRARDRAKLPRRRKKTKKAAKRA